MNKEAIDLDELFEFLKIQGVNPIYVKEHNGFSRNIEFTVENQKYEIIWYKNVSTLLIGDSSNKRRPQIPFKWVYLDKSFPISGNCLGFAHTKFEKRSIFDREYPYESFRIPLEEKIN